jgi:hypothetical protein
MADADWVQHCAFDDDQGALLEHLARLRCID